MASLINGEQRFFEETLPVSELKLLLDGSPMSTPRGQLDRVRGLKWLLAMISKGMDVSRFFPDVVRNVITLNLELKKLVYMFLNHYADLDENTRGAALLAINAFQKDLKDDNELIRALALRTLTSFRVDDIAGVQALAVQECSRDVSPYVRKTAAIAVTKLPFEARRNVEDQVLGRLLLDSNPAVVGSACSAALNVCPDRVDLLHPAFQRLVVILGELDEWGQVAALSLLQRYARHCFASPGRDTASSALDAVAAKPAPAADSAPSLAPARPMPTRQELEAFLDDEGPALLPPPPPSSSSAAPCPPVAPPPSEYSMDADLKHLLSVALPLLSSRHSGVVVAAAMMMWNCGRRSPSAMRRVAEALCRLCKHARPEVRYCALSTMLPLAREAPHLFEAHLEDFFVQRQADPTYVALLKLDALCLLVRPGPALDRVLLELESYCADADDALACAAVRAAGELGRAHPGPVARNVLQGLLLLAHAGTFRPAAAAQAVVAARLVVQADPDASALRAALLRLPDEPRARAATLWLACEFMDRVPLHACEALRLGARAFAREAKETRLQGLALAARVAARPPVPEAKALAEYVFALAAFDPEYDVRDRARTLRALDPALLFAAKPLPGVAPLARLDLAVDSLSHILGSKMDGYLDLPPWTDKPVPSSTRAAPPPAFEKGPDTYAHRTSGLYYGQAAAAVAKDQSSSSSNSSSSSSSSDSDDSNSDSEQPPPPRLPAVTAITTPTAPWSFIPSPVHVTVFVPTTSATASIPATSPVNIALLFTAPAAALVFRPLLSHTKGGGLQAEFCFARTRTTQPLQLTLRFTNRRDETIADIRVLDSLTNAPARGFADIPSLNSGCSAEASLECDFGPRWKQAKKFTITTAEGNRYPVEFVAPVGELLVPATDMFMADFAKQQALLGGMHETRLSGRLSDSLTSWANLGSPLQLQPFSAYAGRRLDERNSLMLVSVHADSVVVNCQDAMAGMALAEELRGKMVKTS